MTDAAQYADDLTTVYVADCRDVVRTLPDASVDAIVTDPPYELGFMGKGWDASGIAYDVALWADCLRVLKPGGHLLAFGGTRTWHRLVCAVEDAGFEVRDSIAWVYASGFPKSLDVSKAIDKAAGAAPESPNAGRWNAGSQGAGVGHGRGWGDFERHGWAPATDAARRWQGWGTALKPAHEPIVVARKPLAGTVAGNVLAHGTGALNIDGCRVPSGEAWGGNDEPSGSLNGYGPGDGDGDGWQGAWTKRSGSHDAGRWPSNLVLTHAPDCGPTDATPCVPGCPVAELDAQSGDRKAGGSLSGGEPSRPFRDAYGVMDGRRVWESYGDEGGASRFFPAFRYEAKAPTAERPRAGEVAHPTVKPLDLMRWLVRLVTPPGGTVLEPFAGSGSTCEAAAAEGFRCIAVEREPDYLPLIVQRLTKRADPVAHLTSKGADLGLFDLLDTPTDPDPTTP